VSEFVAPAACTAKLVTHSCVIISAARFTALLFVVSVAYMVKSVTCSCVTISATRFTALLFVAYAADMAKDVTYSYVTISATRFTLLLFAPRHLPSSGIISFLNSSRSTLFVPFRERGIMRLCLLPSLRLRTRTLTPVCSKRFVKFVETSWAVLVLVT
jgi:hypothetical protein